MKKKIIMKNLHTVLHSKSASYLDIFLQNDMTVRTRDMFCSS